MNIQHFDIRLTTQELDQIANLLAQQPWHQVNNLLTNIKSQVDFQQKAAAAEAQVGQMIRPNGVDHAVSPS